MTNLDSILKSRDITLSTKVHLSRLWFFQWSCMDVRVGLKERWALKNWCFWSVVLEKTLESHLDCKEIQLVHPKGNQSWVFFGRTDAEAETLILWPPHMKSWLIGKDSDAGRDWGQEEKGMTEDEMAGWHHQLDRREFEWTLGVSDGQGGLACCNSRGHKESDTSEQLNWTEQMWIGIISWYSYWEAGCCCPNSEKNFTEVGTSVHTDTRLLFHCKGCEEPVWGWGWNAKHCLLCYVINV